MGKSFLTGHITDESKEAIAKAAGPIIGNRSSMTKLLEAVGVGFQGEIARLEQMHGNDIPPCEMRIQMIPKTERS